MQLLIKNLVFTIVVPGTVAVYIPVFVFSHSAISAVGLFGIPWVLIGAFIYAWCLWDFATFGRGTPAPIDPPKHLVVRGLYRYCRNPMYVGVLCAILGWSLLFRSFALVVYGACTALVFHLFVLLYEEPHLRRVFGPSYEQYCSEVNRWLPSRRGRAAA